MNDGRVQKKDYCGAGNEGRNNKRPAVLDRLNESIPLWAVLEMMLKLIDRLDPPTQSYD